jgi:cytoskeletal protein RodZ
VESFDPFSEWLGRPVGRPPEDHYELLGLPKFEPDLELIDHAADMLRAKIRKVRPGAYVAEWQRLLDRLETAKICLSDPISKAAYDESIDTASHTLNVSGEPVVTWDSSNGEPAMSATTPGGTNRGGTEADQAGPSDNTAPQFVEAPPLVDDAAPEPQAQEGVSEAQFPAIRPTRRKPNRKRLMAQFLVVTVVLLALAIGLVVLKRERDSLQMAGSQPPSSENEASVSPPGPPSGVNLPSPETSDEPPSPATDAPKPDSTPRSDTAPTVPAPKPVAATPSVTPNRAQPAPPAPKLDPARQQAFQRAVASARKALASRDLEAAATHLSEAVSLSQTDEELAEADQVEVLRAHVEAFWGSLQEQIPKLEPGSEILVGEVVALVVETGADFVILRVKGQNRRYSLQAMPHVLAAAMARTLFSNSFNARALRASFLVAEPDGDREKARQLLQEASQGGAEVDELQAELNRSS